MQTRRQRRIAHLRATMPKDVYLQGFGGSSMASETMVFYDRQTGHEIRIPLDLRGWRPTKQDLHWGYDALSLIEREYGCGARMDWTDYETNDD